MNDPLKKEADSNEVSADTRLTRRDARVRSRAAKRKLAQERRQARTSNLWADVKPRGRGLRAISKVKVAAEVSIGDVEDVPRDISQGSTETYFTTPVEVFSRHADDIKHSHIRYDLLPFLAIWPDPLEHQLDFYDARRFGHTDEDAVGLMDMTVEIFLWNLVWNIIYKRIFQAGFIALELAAGVAVLAWLCSVPPSLGNLAIAIGGFALASVVLIVGFVGTNQDHFDNRYTVAIRETVHQASRFISDRMRTLSVVVEQYTGFVDGLLREGETLPDIKDKKSGKDYKEGRAFLWAQMLIWLPIRTLGLETRLRNRMVVAQKRHAWRDAIGFLLTLTIFLVFFVPTVLQMGPDSELFLAPLRSAVRVYAASGSTALVVRWAFLLIFLVFLSVVSFLSYYHPRWNSGKDILEQYFDTEKWATFANSEFDVRIAARLQLAMIQIEHMTHLIHK